MAVYSIKWLKNFFGTKFFPITHINAVRDDDNNTLETLLNNKADEATTLAGYGITDAYTKTEANSHFQSLDTESSISIRATSSAPLDLNDFTTPGTYVSGNLSSYRFISNMPSNFSIVDMIEGAADALTFRLYVFKNYETGNTIKQRIEHTRATNCNVWERIRFINTWSNWVLVQDDLSKYTLSEGSSSDARLKDKVDDINLNIEDIAKAPNLTFKWKDGKDNNLHGGTYAQYWENITPYYVHGSDSKTLEYGNLALTCSIELAKEMTKLKEENVQLKKELEDIKETLNKLNK